MKSCVLFVHTSVDPITTCQLSQKLALACLEKCGKSWISHKVATLNANREEVWNAIKDFPGTVKTSGALYFMVQVPCNGVKATEYLAKEWNVLVIPCEGCGMSDCIKTSDKKKWSRSTAAAVDLFHFFLSDVLSTEVE